MKFSIITDDNMIVIDGVAATSNDGRVASMAGSDVHAIQYDSSKSIGHIEYRREIDDKNHRGNEIIHDLDTEKFIGLHSTLLAEMNAENERLKEEQ